MEMKMTPQDLAIALVVGLIAGIGLVWILL